MKKTLSILLTLFLCFTLFPLNVFADGYTEINSVSQIATNVNGNYKLTEDLYLDTNINFGTSGRSITIDLNGYKIYGPTTGYCFRVAGATLTIEDNSLGQTGGIVTRATNERRSIFWLVGGVTSHVIINGGTYDGSSLTNVTSNGAMCVIETPSTFEINAGTFENFATSNEGGLFSIAGSNASITINEGTFQNNAAKDGAIFYIAGSNDSIIINGGTFDNNSTTLVGGVAYAYGTSASITVNDGTFTNNSATDGGVFYINNSKNSTLAINGGTYTGNSSTSTGGGVIYVHQNNDFYLNGGTFTGNSAPRGGAILLQNNTINFYLGGNPKIYGNTASVYGHDLFLAAYSGGTVGTFRASSLDLASDAIIYISTNNEANDVVLGTVKNSNDVSNCFFDSRGNYGYRQEGSQILFGHKHGDEYFRAWSSDSALPTNSGRYFLTKDVQLSEIQYIGGDSEVSVCLNGHTITQTKADSEVIILHKNATLSIYDCTESGNPAGTYSAGLITGAGNSCIRLRDSVATGEAEIGATFNLYGGRIEGNEAIDSGAAVVLEGHGTFNMYGGLIKNNHASRFGGGVYAKDLATVNLLGGAFNNDRASADGGAVALANGANAYVNGTTFINNDAYRNGGAIYLQNDGTSLQIDSGTFRSNRSRTSGGGAICAFSHCSVLINDANILNNAAVYGGGIWIRKAYATINDCTITGNSASVTGGGIQAQGIDIPIQTSALVLNDGYIANNEAPLGGGIYIGGTSIIYLNDGTIEDNLATDGAGVYLGTLGYGIISNVDIVDNTASGLGGGIYAKRGTKTEIIDINITGNSATNGGGIFIDDDFKMTNINVSNNSATNGTGGIYVNSADYDGESYYSSIIKMAGKAYVYGNSGSHPNLYVASNSIVNGSGSGFDDGTKIGVAVASGNLSKSFIARGRIENSDNEYIVTKYYDYLVTLNINGGTFNEPEIFGYNAGQTITLPTNVSKNDNIFSGWYNNAEFTGSPVTSISASDTGNKVFYAKWEQHHDHGSYTGGIPSNVEWIPWERSDSLPSVTSLGNQNAYYNKYYYLTCDVYLTQRQVIQRTVTIDLNGYSIYKDPNATFTGSMISVNGKWANPLTITNCKATFDEDGFLTSTAGFHNSNATGTEGAVISASGDASKNEFPNVRLYGINFEGNSNIRTSNEEWIPGVIFWRANTTLTIESCAFRNNVSGSALDETSTYGSGGAIALKNIDGGSAAGTININKTLFDGNKAGNRGSAITIPSGAVGTVNINNSKFVNNKVVSSSASVGGVIAAQDGTVNISNTSFMNNENAGNNATVIYTSGNSNVSLDNVTMTGNRNTNQYTAYKAAVTVIGSPTFTVKGKTIISGNTNSANKPGNVFLRVNGNALAKMNAVNLDADAEIYVSTNGTVDENNNYVVVQGSNVKNNIYSEDPNYAVKYIDGNTVLSTPGVKESNGSLVIGENISATVEVVLDANPSDYEVRYTFLGEEKPVAVNSNTLEIEVEDIYAFQMAEPITVDVYYKGDLVDTINYSVKSYCEKQILNSSDPYLVDLCKATLNYGAAAQEYFNGKSWHYGTYAIDMDNLANSISASTTISDSSKPTNTRSRTGDLGGAVYNMEYTLVVGAEISMKFYIYTNRELDLENLEIGCSPAKEHTDILRESEGRYSVKIKDIKAAELGTDFTITFIEGENSMTVTYSPYAFAAAKWDGNNSLAELCKKLVTYGDRAISYVANKEA